MKPVQKALWHIERYYDQEVTLAALAADCGVSRYHMVRAFAAATGYSVMRYVRARRLSDAAKALADGAPDILEVALGAGYGSHEAFTRAFRERFGMTPEAVRAQRHLDNLQLVEPIIMDTSQPADLKPPRFEEREAFLIAGIGARYNCESNAAIPQQWQRFRPHIGHVPGQVGGLAYGVCCNADDEGNFDYIAGVEVSDFDDLPEDFARLRVPAKRYAVFSHDEHISTIRNTVNAIWNDWLPNSGYKAAESANFELYSKFDPDTGTGGLEIWLPLEA